MSVYYFRPICCSEFHIYIRLFPELRSVSDLTSIVKVDNDRAPQLRWHELCIREETVTILDILYSSLTTNIQFRTIFSIKINASDFNMNSIDIYNAMMTQHKSRDFNSNFYNPRKGKWPILIGHVLNKKRLSLLLPSKKCVRNPSIEWRLILNRSIVIKVRKNWEQSCGKFCLWVIWLSMIFLSLLIHAFQWNSNEIGQLT